MENWTAPTDPDRIDRLILEIASKYPPRTPPTQMDPRDKETILALQSIPRQKRP